MRRLTSSVYLHLVAACDRLVGYQVHVTEWYRLGGEISERQWLDVLGVLRVHEGTLDDPYLDRWAGELGLSELLSRARDAARGERGQGSG